jgi:hypothetical protein
VATVRVALQHSEAYEFTIKPRRPKEDHPQHTKSACWAMGHAGSLMRMPRAPAHASRTSTVAKQLLGRPNTVRLSWRQGIAVLGSSLPPRVKPLESLSVVALFTNCLSLFGFHKGLVAALRCSTSGAYTVLTGVSLLCLWIVERLGYAGVRGRNCGGT